MHTVIVINYELLSAVHHPAVYIGKYKTNFVGAWGLCGREQTEGKQCAFRVITSHSSFTRVTIRDKCYGVLLSVNRFLHTYLENRVHDP